MTSRRTRSRERTGRGVFLFAWRDIGRANGPEARDRITFARAGRLTARALMGSQMRGPCRCRFWFDWVLRPRRDVVGCCGSPLHLRRWGSCAATRGSTCRHQLRRPRSSGAFDWRRTLVWERQLLSRIHWLLLACNPSKPLHLVFETVNFLTQRAYGLRPTHQNVRANEPDIERHRDEGGVQQP